MKYVNCYDDDCDRIEKICDKYDLDEIEVIAMLLDYISGEEDLIFK